MTTRRDTAQEDLDLLIDATEELIDALRVYGTTCRTTRGVLSDREPVREAFTQAADANARPVVTDAVLSFERLRHASRLSLLALAAEEGVTKPEIAGTLGISRQLVERWLREAQVREQADRGEDAGSVSARGR